MPQACFPMARPFRIQYWLVEWLRCLRSTSSWINDSYERQAWTNCWRTKISKGRRGYKSQHTSLSTNQQTSKPHPPICLQLSRACRTRWCLPRFTFFLPLTESHEFYWSIEWTFAPPSHSIQWKESIWLALGFSPTGACHRHAQLQAAPPPTLQMQPNMTR